MNIIKFNSDTKYRKQWFAGIHFSHPAKMHLSLQMWLIDNFTKEGETVLEPMAGCGTILVGCSMGRNVICLELEDKFVQMQKGNWEKIRQRGCQLGYQMGKATILQGDARALSGLLVDKCIFSPPFSDSLTRWGGISGKEVAKRLPQAYADNNPSNIGNLPYGEIDKIITSPPYAETGVGDWQTGRAEFQNWVLNELATTGYVEWQGKRYTESEWRAMNHGRIDGRTTKGVHKHPTDGYSKDPDNLGNLPYGSIDAVISSPPHEDIFGASRHGEKIRLGKCQIVKEKRLPSPYTSEQIQNNIGNLKGDTYLSAMLQVYQQCHSVLKDGGLMILVTKNFIRNKKQVRLDLDTIKLCEQAGFAFQDRWYRELASQSFWRTIYHQRCWHWVSDKSAIKPKEHLCATCKNYLEGAVRLSVLCSAQRKEAKTGKGCKYWVWDKPYICEIGLTCPGKKTECPSFWNDVEPIKYEDILVFKKLEVT